MQLIPAYALTAHKGQGLTLTRTYLGLDDLFGYGLAYTMFTRTRFAENMCAVGVPPKDVLEAIVVKHFDGMNAIDRKREQLQTLLQNTSAFDEKIDRRIRAGEFNLNKIADDLKIQGDPLTRESDARLHLREVLYRHYADWCCRLYTDRGLEAMCKVNQWGYSYKKEGVYVWKNNTWWKTLAGTLQNDNATRSRILYYYTIMNSWFKSPTVNALAYPEGTSPVRQQASSKTVNYRDGRLPGYSYGNSETAERTPFPAEPVGFDWHAGKTENSNKKTNDPTTTGIGAANVSAAPNFDALVVHAASGASALHACSGGVHYERMPNNGRPGSRYLGDLGKICFWLIVFLVKRCL